MKNGLLSHFFIITNTVCKSGFYALYRSCNLDHGIEKMREHGIMRLTKGRSVNYVIQNVHVGIQSKGSHRGSPSGEKSLSEIASQHNLNPNMVRNWKSEFLENASRFSKNPKKAEKAARRKEEAPEERKGNHAGKLSVSWTIECDFLQDCFAEAGRPGKPNLIRKNADLSVRR